MGDAMTQETDALAQIRAAVLALRAAAGHLGALTSGEIAALGRAEGAATETHDMIARRLGAAPLPPPDGV